MVNEVFHRANLSFANEDTESEDGDTVTTVSPEISLPKHQAEKTRAPLSQIFIRSFKAVTRIKGAKQNDSKHIEQFLREIAGERLERFSLRQIKSFTGNFSSKVGMGGFGSVYRGLMPNGVDVAVKLKRNKDITPEFMAEVSILSRTYHKNLVTLLGYCVDGDVKALVYEYMANGSLERVLVSNNNGVAWDILESIAIEIAKGIAYLHEECPKVIIHLDVKPHNILLSQKYSPRLADFGLAVQFDGDHKGDGIHASVRGTYGYIEPEFCINEYATCKSDVYSFGMVLFDILGRCNLHGNERYDHEIFPRQVWDKFQTGNLDYLKERTGRMSMAALWCIQDRPDDRPSMSTVVSILKGDIEVKQPPYAYSGFSKPYSHANTGSSIISLRNEGITEINAVQSGPGYESDTVLFTPTTETNGVEMAT